MKWITAEEVKAYATTPEHALNISIAHHQQNVDATEKELFAHSNPLAWSLCGLCRYYETDCSRCPLGSCYPGSLYAKASAALKPSNHAAFIKAETALLNKLKSLQSGDNDMDKKKKLEIQIAQNEKDQEKLQEVGRELKARIADAEVTYSIADRFKCEDGEEFILAAGSDDKAALYSLSKGTRWRSAKEVDDKMKITQKELSGILGNLFTLTRYWDNRKQVDCE